MQCYVNQGMDVAKMLDRMTDQETLIQTLELELQEIRDEREIEREKQWNEVSIALTLVLSLGEVCWSSNTLSPQRWRSN